MAKRMISVVFDLELKGGSKEAHAVTVEKIVRNLGPVVVEAFEKKGYTVKSATSSTTMHYVRHVLQQSIRANKRILKRVV